MDHKCKWHKFPIGGGFDVMLVCQPSPYKLPTNQTAVPDKPVSKEPIGNEPVSSIWTDILEFLGRFNTNRMWRR